MPKVDGGIVIERPVQDVFTYATSAESHLRWVPGIREAVYLDEGPVQVGSRWRATVAFGGIQVETVNEVTEVVANRKFSWRSVDGPVQSCGSYEFTPLAGERTRFDFQIASDDKLARLGGLAMPLALRMLRRELRNRLARVKTSMEAGELSVI